VSRAKEELHLTTSKEGNRGAMTGSRFMEDCAGSLVWH